MVDQEEWMDVRLRIPAMPARGFWDNQGGSLRGWLLPVGPCVFRGSWPPIPAERGHLFRLNLATGSPETGV